MLHNNISINSAGHLTFAGCDATDLVAGFGTALYLLDEERIRTRCREYVSTMSECLPAGSVPLYAGKALSFREMYRLINSEGMSADVVSGGEIVTALSTGFPAQRMYFHGNNKTDADIALAIDKGVGHFIIDGTDELFAVAAEAARRGRVQDVLLRLTPGIDPHTFEAVNTGRLDCQFGVPIATGDAMEFLRVALTLPSLHIEGLHCHVGSQVFDAQPFLDAADIMLDFMATARDSMGFDCSVLDLGGGFGVRYVDSDPYLDIPTEIRRLAAHVRSSCAGRGLSVPAVLLEPGRSIVADAGMTLYTVGTVKSFSCSRSFVSIDGGMSDNPRYALYGSLYTVYLANRMNETADFTCTVAGRCCESGALIAENVKLPKPVRGDIVAVAVTGAYNFSMASNYNRVCRPAVVMLKDGIPRIVVRRQTAEDVMAQDL